MFSLENGSTQYGQSTNVAWYPRHAHSIEDVDGLSETLRKLVVDAYQSTQLDAMDASVSCDHS